MFFLIAALGAGFSLFSSAVSAVASVIGTIKKKGKIYLLVVSNIASGIGQIIAFVCWMIQFFQYLTHNTLMVTDMDKWTTNDNTGFGYSFYFIIIAFLIVLVNIFLLTSGTWLNSFLYYVSSINYANYHFSYSYRKTTP